MATKISSIYTLITADDKPLKRGLEKARRTATKGAKQIQDRLNGINFRAVGLGLAAFGTGLGLAMSKAVGYASDLEEVTSKFNVVFRDQLGLANQWSSELVDAYGLSTREAKQYLSSVQDLLKPMGVASDVAGKLSSEIVKLSVELGSFNNQRTEDVMRDIQNALVGNFETMKKYGVVLTATAVQQEALRNGLAKTAKELTVAQKAQTAYNIIVRSSADAIGDWARTQNSFANQMKVFRRNVEETFTRLGEKVLPVANAMIQAFNWILGPSIPKSYSEVAAEILRIEGLLTDPIRMQTYNVNQLSMLTDRLGMLRKKFKSLSDVAKGTKGTDGKAGSVDIDKPTTSFEAMSAHEFARFKQHEILKRDIAKETYEAMSAHEHNRFKQSEVLQRDALTKVESTFNAMVDLSERTAWAMQDNFSNLFFDAMQGELKSLEDYLTAVLDSIQRAIADVAAQMVTRGLFGDIGSAGGGGGFFGSLFRPDVKAQHGAYLGERIRGYGESGRSYEFHPNEIVAPLGKGSGSGIQVDVNVANNLGVEAEVNQTQTFVNPEKVVTDIVLNRKLTSRGFRQGLRS